jgi:hypothetical protein
MASREHPSGSFLIRVWSENQDNGEPPRVRIFMRNLKTGEEQYLGDLDQIGETVLRQFQQRMDGET